jgi:acyl-CoA thioesterase
MDGASMAEDALALARRIVDRMIEHDAYSAWLGIEVLDVRPHGSTLRMVVRDEMLNGFGVCHGGVTFSLADSAFAFACNTHGRVTVSIENSMTYPAAVRAGDVLTAVAERETESQRLGYFKVVVTNQRGETVGLFRGTSYKTSREHFPGDASSSGA